MVVDSVMSLDQEELNDKLIGMKKVPGGGLQDSLFVNGVAFKKTVSYPFYLGNNPLTLADIIINIVLLCRVRTAAQVLQKP